MERGEEPYWGLKGNQQGKPPVFGDAPILLGSPARCPSLPTFLLGRVPLLK